MKTILYMASTLNGYIAKVDDSTSWTSKEDWQVFLTMARKMDAIIIGRRTYDVIRKEHTQIQSAFTVVLTRNIKLLRTNSHTFITDKSLTDVFKLLKDKGCKQVMIAGGGILNSSFMKAGLIDEIYLTIEPIILGRGIPLFADSDFEARLQLLSMKKINKNTIQLHYKVNA